MDWNKFCIFVAFLLALSLDEGLSNSTPQTPQETAALNELKASVLPKIPKTSFVYKFAQDDLYLLRWLQASAFVAKSAERSLLQHLKWREVVGMDKIETEDWSEFASYPAYFDTYDNLDRPVAELWMSEWNIPKAVTSGNARQFYRWFMRIFELQTRRLYESRAGGSSSLANVVILADFESFGYNNACPHCLALYANLMQSLEKHYPGLLGEVYLLNIPPSFENVLRIAGPLLKPGTRAALKPYVIKEEWMEILDEKVYRNERSTRFGGTLPRY